MLWLQHDLLNRHHDMPNFHRDELFLQHDLNGRNTIFFFMHKTALACHTFFNALSQHCYLWCHKCLNPSIYGADIV